MVPGGGLNLPHNGRSGEIRKNGEIHFNLNEWKNELEWQKSTIYSVRKSLIKKGFIAIQQGRLNINPTFAWRGNREDRLEAKMVNIFSRNPGI